MRNLWWWWSVLIVLIRFFWYTSGRTPNSKWCKQRKFRNENNWKFKSSLQVKLDPGCKQCHQDTIYVWILLFLFTGRSLQLLRPASSLSFQVMPFILATGKKLGLTSLVWVWYLALNHSRCPESYNILISQSWVIVPCPEQQGSPPLVLWAESNDGCSQEAQGVLSEVQK